MSTLPTSFDFLKKAALHQRDRAAQRDTPDGERTMGATVTAFNAIYKTDLTEEQGWMFQALLKAARSANGLFVADDYEDLISYGSLAGEAAARDRQS